MNPGSAIFVRFTGGHISGPQEHRPIFIRLDTIVAFQHRCITTTHSDESGVSNYRVAEDVEAIAALIIEANHQLRLQGL